MPAPAASTPRVSVIVAMFDAEATIRETIESVRAQEVRGGWEAVVVDDGSTDDGPEIVARLAARDPRIRLVRQENAGAAAAKNHGLDEARGEYVRFLDADDWFTPGSLQRLIDAAEAGGTGAAFGAFDVRDEDGQPLDRVAGSWAAEVGLDQLLDSNHLGTAAHVVRRSLVGKQRFDPGMRVCEDWDLWLRLAERGVRWKRVERFAGVEVVASYRVRAASLSKDFAGMARAAEDLLWRGYARSRAAEVQGIDLSEERRQHAVGGQALAFATMSALVGKIDRAAAMAEVADAEHRFTTVQAASAAVWGVVMAMGVRPETRGEPRGRWVRHLAHWWSRCEALGWMAPGEETARWAELARQCVAPGAVARHLVGRCAAAGARHVIVVGTGQNGRRVLEALRGAAVTVAIRDDRLSPGDEPPGLPPGVSVQPVDAPVPAGATLILTPGNDRRLLERVQRFVDPRSPAGGLLRWAEAADELAEAEAADLAAWAAEGLDIGSGRGA